MPESSDAHQLRGLGSATDGFLVAVGLDGWIAAATASVDPNAGYRAVHHPGSMGSPIMAMPQLRVKGVWSHAHLVVEWWSRRDWRGLECALGLAGGICCWHVLAQVEGMGYGSLQTGARNRFRPWEFRGSGRGP